MKFWIAAIAAAVIASAGVATAQWWNPLESDCQEYARLEAEQECKPGGGRRRKTESASECEARMYPPFLVYCKAKE
jgi:hypothetical protein